MAKEVSEASQAMETVKENGNPEGSDALRGEEEVKKKRKSLKEELRDPVYRRKFVHSLCIAQVFFAMGMSLGLDGATFLDLQIITNTDTEKAAVFFSAGSFGFLIGSAIVGVLYTYVRQSLVIFLGTISLGVIMIVTPYCSPYALMIAIRGLGGVASGFVETTGNTNNMQIWGNEGEMQMQLIHFGFALGGAISPLYAEPFLAPREEEENVTNTVSRALIMSTAVPLNLSTGGYNYLAPYNNGSYSDNSTASGEEARKTEVAYAFLITGLFYFVSAIPFVVIYVREKVKEKKMGEKEKAQVLKQRELPRPVLLLFLVPLCIFLFTYGSIDDTIGSFLMTFLVNQYDFVSKSESAYIIAFYRASFAVSRFVMIFMSKLFSPVKLITLCCSLMLVAFGGFFISATFGAIEGMTTFIVLAGFSMSAVVPSIFSWTEKELIRVTGFVSSTIVISASVGTMTNPLLLSYLMESVSNMWFCYLLITQMTIACLTFIFLLTFNRLYLNRKYGKLPASSDIVIDAVEPDDVNQPLCSSDSEKWAGNNYGSLKETQSFTCMRILFIVSQTFILSVFKRGTPRSSKDI